MDYVIHHKERDSKYDLGDVIICNGLPDLYTQLRFLAKDESVEVDDVRPDENSSREFISYSVAKQVEKILGYMPKDLVYSEPLPQGMYRYEVLDTTNGGRRVLTFKQKLELGKSYNIQINGVPNTIKVIRQKRDV